MKFDNKLQENIFNYFTSREDFHFHGYAGTFFFKTWEKGEEKKIIHSKKPHGDKDMISASVLIYSNRYHENEKYGVEMKIEFNKGSYLDVFYQIFSNEMKNNSEIILKGNGATEVWSKYWEMRLNAQSKMGELNE